jgi:hypothetical protein
MLGLADLAVRDGSADAREMCKRYATPTFKLLMAMVNNEPIATKPLKYVARATAWLAAIGVVVTCWASMRRAEDESRLRLAAAKGVVALNESPLFRDEMDGERLVILSQVLADPCPQLRRQWAFRIHKGLRSLDLTLLWIAMLGMAALDPDAQNRHEACAADRTMIVIQARLALSCRPLTYFRDPSCAGPELH